MLVALLTGTDSDSGSGDDSGTSSGRDSGSSFGAGGSDTEPGEGSVGGDKDDSDTESDEGSVAGGVGGGICCGSWLPPELYDRVWPPGRGTSCQLCKTAAQTN